MTTPASLQKHSSTSSVTVPLTTQRSTTSASVVVPTGVSPTSTLTSASTPSTGSNKGIVAWVLDYLSGLFQSLRSSMVSCLSSSPLIRRFFKAAALIEIPSTDAGKLEAIQNYFKKERRSNRAELQTYVACMAQIQKPTNRFGAFVAVLQSPSVSHTVAKSFYDQLLEEQKNALLDKIKSTARPDDTNAVVPMILSQYMNGITVRVCARSLYEVMQTQEKPIPSPDPEKLATVQGYFKEGVPDDSTRELCLQWMGKMQDPADKFGVFVAVVSSPKGSLEVVRPFYNELPQAQKSILLNQIESFTNKEIPNGLVKLISHNIEAYLAGDLVAKAAKQVYQEVYNRS